MMEASSSRHQTDRYEEFEELELRRRRRALELKRLQIEESKLDIERATLEQQHRYAPQFRIQSKRGGRSPLHTNTAAATNPILPLNRGTTPPPQQQQHNFNHRSPASQQQSQSRNASLSHQQFSPRPPSSQQQAATGGPQVSTGINSRGRKQRRGQGSLERRREARAAAREAAIQQAAIGNTKINKAEHWSASWNDGRLHAGAPAFEPASDRSQAQSQAHQSNSANAVSYETGWSRIADMLHDSDESNRTSAVHALHVLGEHSHRLNPNDQASGGMHQQPHANHQSSAAAAAASSSSSWSTLISPKDWNAWQSPWTGATTSEYTASERARESAYRAVLDSGGIAPLVDLLSDDTTATQRAAVDVLRNVVAASNKVYEHNESFPPPARPISPTQTMSSTQTHKINDSNFAHTTTPIQNNEHDTTKEEPKWLQLMEEADIVGPILNLLESDDAEVRASALGTVSELANASEEARNQFFQDPALLASLFEIVEHKETPPSELHTTTTTLAKEESNDPNTRHSTEGRSSEHDPDDFHLGSDPAADTFTSEYVESGDRTQAVGVLKLMLEEEGSAQRVREALATRPGVVESIVDVTTQQWPRTDDTVLQGLGPEASEVAATAVVQLLGDGHEVDRNDTEVNQESNAIETTNTTSLPQQNGQDLTEDTNMSGYASPPPGPRASASTSSKSEGDNDERRRRQLAAMAAMRNLVTNEDPSEESASRAALNRIRSTGGVGAVLDLLNDDDPMTQASASCTLRALVRADDQLQQRDERRSNHPSLDENIYALDPIADSDIVADEHAAPLSGGDGDTKNLEAASTNSATGGTDSSLRTELAAGQAVPMLVSVLSRAKEEPGAAVQAAATLVELVEGEEQNCPEDAASQDVKSQIHDEGDVSENTRLDEHALVKTRLKEAIHEDSSVIPAIVDLLREALDVGADGNTAARSLAETLRAAADSDLVNQMRIRDAGGVRPLMTILTQIHGQADDNDPIVATVSPADSNASEISAHPNASAPAPSSGELVRDVGKVWLSSEHTPACTNSTAPAQETNGPIVEELTSTPLLLSSNSDLATSSGKGAVVIRDDIGVRFGNKPTEFSHECTSERILEQPLGFRQWYMTHSVTANMRRRATEARADQYRLGGALNKLRLVEEQLRNAFSDQSQPVDERLLHRYDRLQRELDYVQGLYDSLGRECDVLERNKADSYLNYPDDPDNAKAELHLLDSTLKVLGEYRSGSASGSHLPGQQPY